MGTVWVAEHLSLRSRIAIKLIDPERVSNPDSLRRFMLEAQAAAALQTPHVVHVFDFGEDDGVAYIAMELLAGETLAQHLHRVRTLTIEETAEVVGQIARALGRAHEAGIVHRDLKPDNVFLVKNDESVLVKILDFGIAKTKSDEFRLAGPETATGALLGTPFYMSPEQIEDAKDIDHRADLWALALIAFECLVGKRPFHSDRLGELILQICMRPLPVPSEHGNIPPGFDEWFTRATARDRMQRFATAREMANALREVARAQGGRVVITPGTLAHPLANTQAVDETLARGADVHRPMTTGQASAALVDVPAGTSNRRSVVAALATGAIVVVASYALLRKPGEDASRNAQTLDGASTAQAHAPDAALSIDASLPSTVSSSSEQPPAQRVTDAYSSHDTDAAIGAPDASRTRQKPPRAGPRINWGL